MFNKLKKEKLMYTLNTFQDMVDDIILNRRIPLSRTYTHAYSNFDVELQEDGKQKITIPVTGHNPKDITVDVTDETIHIKASTEDTSSRFVKDIDLELSVGSDYDGTKSTAKFENGLLTLLIDKKNERKAKSLKISY